MIQGRRNPSRFTNVRKWLSEGPGLYVTRAELLQVLEHYDWARAQAERANTWWRRLLRHLLMPLAFPQPQRAVMEESPPQAPTIDAPPSEAPTTPTEFGKGPRPADVKP